MTTTPQPIMPTQVRRPWRATIRTFFAAFITLAAIAPLIVEATGLNQGTLPWIATVLAVCAGVTRVMALPAVELFLSRFLPFLAADPIKNDDTIEGAL